MAKKDRVPGTFKSSASYEAKTLSNPKTPDKAFKDTRVLDEDYSYTTPEFPGFVEPDLNLSRAERARVIHRP